MAIVEDLGYGVVGRVLRDAFKLDVLPGSFKLEASTEHSRRLFSESVHSTQTFEPHPHFIAFIDPFVIICKEQVQAYVALEPINIAAVEKFCDDHDAMTILSEGIKGKYFGRLEIYNDGYMREHPEGPWRDAFNKLVEDLKEQGELRGKEKAAQAQRIRDQEILRAKRRFPAVNTLNADGTTPGNFGVAALGPPGLIDYVPDAEDDESEFGNIPEPSLTLYKDEEEEEPVVEEDEERVEEEQSE